MMSRRKQFQPRHFDTDPVEGENSGPIDQAIEASTPGGNLQRKGDIEGSIEVQRLEGTLEMERGSDLKDQVPNPGSEKHVDYIGKDEIIKDPSARNAAELPPTNQAPLEYHKKLYLRTKTNETSFSLQAGFNTDLSTFNGCLPQMEDSKWIQLKKDHTVEHKLDDCHVKLEGKEGDEVQDKTEGPLIHHKEDMRKEITSLCTENVSSLAKPSGDEAITDDKKVEDAEELFEEPKAGSTGRENEVKLETLRNTSVAVAQIVENNLPSADMVPSLMQTVYSLWQQQMMQCQMLEVVRRHLVTLAKDRNIMLPSLPASSTTDELDYLSIPDAEDVEKSGASYRNSNTTSPMSQDTSEVGESDKCHANLTKALPGVMVPGGKAPSPSSSSSSEQIIKSSTMGVTSPSAAAEVPSQFMRGAGNKLDVGTALDRSQYAADDPLFRHKCRFCDKIFGSDSALQIHVRSHTGERPYVCDVCGSKFSTRGNLKVHYEGHLLDSHQQKTNRPSEGSQLYRPPVHGLNTETKPPISPFPSQPSSVSHFTSLPTADTPIKTEARVRDTFPYISPTSDQDNFQARQHNHHVPSTSPMVGQGPPVSYPGPPPMLSSFTSPPMGSSASLGRMPPPPLPPFMKSSILPQQDEDDAMEQFMEVTKSETSKLEAMVKNIETTLSDPNQCLICKRVLSCKSALQMHYRTHTGERPFRCKICGRTFTTKGNLKTHMGVHRLKPPVRAMHQCPVCQKQFTNTIVLQQHMHSYHSDIPPMMRPGFPGMMPPNSMMPFGQLPMMPPPFMDRMSPFSTNFGLNGMDREHDRAGNNEFSDYEDDNSDFGISEADGSDNPEVGFKRSRMAEEDNAYSESLSDLKRPKVEIEEEDITDDEEVPRDAEIDHSTTKPFDRSFEKPLLPQSLSSEATLKGNSHLPNDSHQYNVSSTKDDRMKGMEEQRYQQEKKGFAEEIRRKLEVGSRAPFTYGPHNNEKDSPRSLVSPIDSTTSLSFSDRNTPRTTTSSPGTSPPLRSQFTPMELPSNSLNFVSARPGFVTTCDLCFKTFACRSALEIHYRSHTKEKPFHCGLCDRGFSTKGNLKQHYLTHKLRELQEAGIDTSKADDDSQDCVQPEEMTNGQRQHQIFPPDLPYHESNPSKVSPDKPEGGYHPSDIKRESGFHDFGPSSVHQPFPPQSNGPAYSPYSESNHPVNPLQPLDRDFMENDYQQSANLKHQCQVCHKPFSSSSALQIHMRTHTGERPFKCVDCNKGFTTKGNLKVHMSTHEDRNAFARRGRRMGLDGFPRFDGIPPTLGLAGLPRLGFLQPPKPSPDLFMPRFPFMGLPGANGFMNPQPNEIPMMQPSSTTSRSMQMSSPNVHLDGTKEQADLKRLREVSQSS